MRRPPLRVLRPAFAYLAAGAMFITTATSLLIPGTLFAQTVEVDVAVPEATTIDAPVTATDESVLDDADPVLDAAAVGAGTLYTPVKCSPSLQAQVDAAAAGSVVHVKPCIYRETVTIDKPLTLVGGPGTEIRGSDEWTKWTRSGRYWTGGSVALDSAATGACLSDPMCQSPYQVFFDGRQLKQVRSAPSRGQFAIDAQRRVLLADNPSGHRVEVTTRAAWILVCADHVTIDGLTMQHAGNSAQTGALRSDGVSHLTVRNSTFAYAHGANVQMLYGAGHQVIGNDIHDAGQLGVSAYQVQDVLVQGNRIHDNNRAGFDPNWEAGGLKISSSARVTLDGNEVYANAGPGLWCDIGCHDVTYSHNRVHDNLYMGIVFEISSGARIVGNAVWNNGSAQAVGWGCNIYVSSSSNVDVSDNTVLATGTHGILVVSENRADAPEANEVHGVSVQRNTIVMNKSFAGVGRTALGWLENWEGSLYAPGANNAGSGNAFWFSYGESSWQRFAWGENEGGQWVLGDFASTPGGQNSRYLSDSERDQALKSANIPFSL